jgi:catechol 2,3-dioxygenase-like lactoylglutathione lyase family enzyme
MVITGFNHSGFVVRDMDTMLRFYRDTLGLTVLRETKSIAPPEGNHTGIPGAIRLLVFVGKPEGEHQLELIYWIKPPSQAAEARLERNQFGSAHVAFNVAGLDEFHRGLTGAGVPFVTPPMYHSLPGGGSLGVCYAQDPEGNWLEFMEEQR